MSPSFEKDPRWCTKTYKRHTNSKKVSRCAQLDATDGKENILRKLGQRIGLIAAKANSVQETKIAHNMFVCQVATFSPICIHMSLKECADIDKQIIKAYQYRLNICIPMLNLGALLWDVEVYISSEGSMPAHALCTSIEEATKQQLWILYQEKKNPSGLNSVNKIRCYQISRKRTLIYLDNFDSPSTHGIYFFQSYSYQVSCYIQYMCPWIHAPRFKQWICARFVDNLLLKDKKVKVIGSPDTTNSATLSAIIGEGNLLKYSLLWHIYLLIQILFEEVTHNRISSCELSRSRAIEEKVSRPAIYRQLAMFSGEILPVKLVATARITIEKYNNDYKLFGFYNWME